MLSFLKKHSHVNWALADQAMVSGVNFLTGILFARYLGIEEFGKFTLVWMAVLFCNSFQQAGIIFPMMSIGPKQNEKHKAVYYGSVAIHQIVWATFCSFFLSFGVWVSNFIRPDWKIHELALPLGATLFSWQAQDFLRRYFFVIHRANYAFISDAISYLGQILVLILLFWITELNTQKVLWIIAATSLISVAYSIFHCETVEFNKSTLSETTQKHWNFSKWMMSAAFMRWLSNNFYLIATGALIGPIAVGGIKAAQNIIAVTHILFQAMENFVPTNASHLYISGGPAILLKYIKKVIVTGGTGTIILILPAVISPEFLLESIYSTDYAEFSFVIRWFCIVYILMFLNMPIVAALRASEKTKPIFISVLFSGIFIMITAYPLTIAWGIDGAMLGLVFSKIGMLTISTLSLKKYLTHEEQ